MHGVLASRGMRDASRGPTVADSRVSTDGRTWGPSVAFAEPRRLDEHYEKHGAEFGNISKQEYLHQAQLLRDAKVEGPILHLNVRDNQFDKALEDNSVSSLALV